MFCPHMTCHPRVRRLSSAASFFSSSHQLVAVQAPHEAKVAINLLKMAPPWTQWLASGRHWVENQDRCKGVWKYIIFIFKIVCSTFETWVLPHLDYPQLVWMVPNLIILYDLSIEFNFLVIFQQNKIYRRDPKAECKILLSYFSFLFSIITCWQKILVRPVFHPCSLRIYFR